ncbi:MAG TPA: glycoside hydrolase family 2 TIM barrel-domain containing protein [Armatimonadota bacterium]|jgi:beta-galactosidase/beta-glucuronidase
MIPRAEYPRPQLVREAWANLNGSWQFCLDQGRSGRARGLPTAAALDGTILVPFCPESRLSGVGYTDFMSAVWYRRTVTLPAAWAGTRVLLHFGAVDFATEVWVNGQSVGTHRGGYSSFSFEITTALQAGENVITVCAEDDTRSPLQARGKQSEEYASHGCDYTRTTGIWQTVWLEAVPATYIAKLKLTPDLANGQVHIAAVLDGAAADGLTLTAMATFDGVAVGTATVRTQAGVTLLTLTVDPAQVHAWAPGHPALYDLQLTLCDDARVLDAVQSYFGLRTITLAPPAILLNGMPVFQRLILDQGFYPDGIYTAPSDDELRADIERSLAMGFNGARLHQKVFEARFLYWADKLGYLVWGEMGSWGLDHGHGDAQRNFLAEWMEIVERDVNHPALVGWCPFNETWGGIYPDLLQLTYRLTKQYDPTRPVIDTSGNYHVGLTDVYDAHDYDQNPATFAARHQPFAEGGAPHDFFPGKDAPYAGQPYFISEYGGIWWNPAQTDENAWGYGNRPQSEDEFLARYRGLTEALLGNPRMCGFCYTQLTDVEQEVNGLYTYDRRAKFDPEIIRAINAQAAAIETERV